VSMMMAANGLIDFIILTVQQSTGTGGSPAGTYGAFFAPGAAVGLGSFNDTTPVRLADGNLYYLTSVITSGQNPDNIGPAGAQATISLLWRTQTATGTPLPYGVPPTDGTAYTTIRFAQNFYFTGQVNTTDPGRQGTTEVSGRSDFYGSDSLIGVTTVDNGTAIGSGNPQTIFIEFRRDGEILS